MPEDAPHKHVVCPACNCLDVRRSWPSGLWDKIMARSGRMPLRCRRCNHRFYRRLSADEKLGLPDPSEERDALL